MNQRDFWRACGVTQSGGSRYESGRRLPKPVQKLLDIAYGPRKASERVIAELRRQA